MEEFSQEFIQGMKSKLDVELIGVASVQDSSSRELKGRTSVLLPNTKSVVVLGKEIYKEVVSLLPPPAASCAECEKSGRTWRGRRSGTLVWNNGGCQKSAMGDSDGCGFCYEPSVSSTSKKRGFVPYVHLGYVISTRNPQPKISSLIND